MTDELLKSAYEGLVATWRALNKGHRSQLLDRFKVSYSFNSGNIENPEITYHDTARYSMKTACRTSRGMCGPSTRSTTSRTPGSGSRMHLQVMRLSTRNLSCRRTSFSRAAPTMTPVGPRASGRERSRRATIASPMTWEPRLRRFPGLLKHWQRGSGGPAL